ncbi:hypothetical protein M8C21_033479 [Ambrosia artemisiifolia]|uniref:EGF-like calcium-binding domain-containing protein n=1 Tax=Ambrosia artemisiifolia TaxID=4212 RepID=A0AAD5GMZ8_AMBAR|nr:hypothetical protein M8C21_033479 [Ambrosia artemisiifolia]
MRIWKLGFVICVWFLFTAEYCLCRFVVENINLKVTSPDSLKGSYKCALANFGIPRYGGTLRGLVKYPKENQDACNSFNDVSFKPDNPGGLPVFVLADRGGKNTCLVVSGCYFSNKSWNAQNAGAAAILVTHETDDLLTMDLPEHDPTATYLENLTISSVFITNSLGISIKKALEDINPVLVTLDWTEALPHPDERVEYEFWTNSNDECGLKCDSQLKFVKTFKKVAQALEQNGHTQFTPHYITWYCPEEYTSSEKCKSQCINHGRYCAPDPEEDFSKGYTGKEVVVQNLIQACFYKVANESGKSWLWWDYVTDFSTHCQMKEQQYNKDCAHKVIASFGSGTRGDVAIQPTLVINNRQYRGRLDNKAVLKAICSEIETNECLVDNGGCWIDKVNNITACKDTFRGKVCECPIVNGVKYVGDGYTHCEHINECKEKKACQCSKCKCKNTWGSYECSCAANLLYLKEHDICISTKDVNTRDGWGFGWVFFGLIAIGVIGYVFYKYRVRRYMDSEIRAIMAQYMPLDGEVDVPVTRSHGEI